MTAGLKGQGRGAGKWSLGKCERYTLPAPGLVSGRTDGQRDRLEEGPTPLGSVQTAEPGFKDHFFKMISHWGEESLGIKCDTAPSFDGKLCFCIFVCVLVLYFCLYLSKYFYLSSDSPRLELHPPRPPPAIFFKLCPFRRA